MPMRWRWPPGEGVGEPVGGVGRQAHEIEQLPDALVAPGVRSVAVRPQRLGDDRAHLHARVERRVRILEDHLRPAAEALERVPLQFADIGAFEADRATGRPVQAEERAADRRLAGARLADEGQGLAPLDCEGDAVDGVKQLRFPAPALRGHLEGDAEIVHLDQRPIAERPIAERAHDGDLTVTLTST